MRKQALDRVEFDPDIGDPLADSEFAGAMLRALRSQPRSIEPKFFYDEAGAALFERICELDEYYLTRDEIAILREHAPAIARLIGPHADIVEFGAGSPLKARIVLDALPSPARYLPVDVSSAHLDGGVRQLERAYPGLSVEPLMADFARPLTLPPRRVAKGRRVGLFLGSTIGNLSSGQAHDFLAATAAALVGGGLLVGVDLVKDPDVLHRAYNDPQGVTAAFNRNLLVRANRELGADFDPASFRHYAFYQPQTQRVEMHLVSARRQIVHVGGHAFAFAEGESLHTENSYKYTTEGFWEMAQRAGFAPGPVWTDAQRRFSVHWLAAPPAGGRLAD
jgi:dimethylhistidine N-methyltransferase